MKPIDSGPGWIMLKGKRYAIPKPTAKDLRRIAEQMREFALEGCTHPVLALNPVAKQLDPALLAAAVDAAVGKAAGGPVEPSESAVLRQYGTLAGVRFQFWYLATRDDSQKSLSPNEVLELVAEADRYDLADALEVATGLRELDREKDDPKASPAGAS